MRTGTSILFLGFALSFSIGAPAARQGATDNASGATSVMETMPRVDGINNGRRWHK